MTSSQGPSVSHTPEGRGRAADRIFLVKIRRVEETTVTMTAADHDEAMAHAERVFPGYEAVEATEDDWPLASAVAAESTEGEPA